MQTSPGDLRIKNVLGRLEMIIDNENARIGTDTLFDIKTSNAHKSRCLYELTLLSRDLKPEDMNGSFVSQTSVLKDKLAENAEKVQAHMEAIRRVVDLLKTATQEAEADGIYSQEQFRYSEQ
ncbi:hypothetical protein IFT84_02750 [Rhizobium sp. CFBP 8762]|uniref:hypothetical protein n=1 Tax=Rhizobium sp. CFBP 8762 TaxID=2775279 RepID=UPI001783B89F|nr:hypothetical protein [Rhizobium sp. CFBP 8762]MBD8553439.1 hypothetical protein [Rhizobium sp. CFBP 8762]